MGARDLHVFGLHATRSRFHAYMDDVVLHSDWILGEQTYIGHVYVSIAIHI